MTAALSELLAWVTGGSALAALGKVLAAACALVFGLIYRRYLGILGADRRKPAERQAYDALRESLTKGNIAARLYAERLTQFLDRVDRFFRDAGAADRTLFPHAFGAEEPGATLDGSGIGPMSASRLDLPNRNNRSDLGDIRSCWPG